MATTTNYGWTTPDDTALVKDGASAIRTLGTSVDTTTKNLNPETTLGDISFRSSTSNVKTRLGIGTAGQVLNVSGGVPAWTTLGASGFSKITSGSFSDVASVTIDDVFSATYLNYMIVLNIYAATRTDDLHMQLRFGASTKTTSYYSSAFRSPPSNTQVGYGESATAQFLLSDRIGNSTEPSAFNLYFSKVGNSSQNPNVWGMGNIDGNNGVGFFSGWNEGAATYTGLVFKSSSSNITGTYHIYGLAN
jgi:hypothetical protein